ncbi:CLUMA_CG016075, isoform A [Clunio marinus]|uniref:CLUMA_CG016075, isoform A n=1 Tax=Clunio marinus TaxID=568069 RepID=A0A1J1IQV1_9DIPT|nr:CLUMA_CG016075, isoform A [Clunio marinus]
MLILAIGRSLSYNSRIAQFPFTPTTFNTSSNGLCSCSLRYRLYVTHALSTISQHNLHSLQVNNNNFKPETFLEVTNRNM